MAVDWPASSHSAVAAPSPAGSGRGASRSREEQAEVRGGRALPRKKKSSTSPNSWPVQRLKTSMISRQVVSKWEVASYDWNTEIQHEAIPQARSGQPPASTKPW